MLANFMTSISFDKIVCSQEQIIVMVCINAIIEGDLGPGN